MLEPILYNESVSGIIVLDWVVPAKRLPVIFPTTLPLSVVAVTWSPWIWFHFNEVEPKLYDESVSGTKILDWVVVATRLPVRFPDTLPVRVSIFAVSAWIATHCNEEVPKLYVESVSGTIPLAWVVDAKRLPVRFPATLPVNVPPDSRVISSAWMFIHLAEVEPKLYVESVSGIIPLAWVEDATRLPVRLPTTLPVTVSIEAASAWIFTHC